MGLSAADKPITWGFGGVGVGGTGLMVGEEVGRGVDEGAGVPVGAAGGESEGVGGRVGEALTTGVLGFSSGEVRP